MSNILIDKYFGGKANIKMLEDIENCNTIDEYFSNHDHVIIFLTNKDCDVGHWVVLIKNNNKCYYFDSYGYAPIDILDEINPNLKSSAEKMNHLIKSKYKNNYFFNPIDYQSEKDDIATCGRYATFTAILNKLLNNYNFDIFYDIVKIFYEKHKMNPDETVCYFIDTLDKK